jgi:hypothetical protein
MIININNSQHFVYFLPDPKFRVGQVVKVRINDNPFYTKIAQIVYNSRSFEYNYTDTRRRKFGEKSITALTIDEV